MPRKLTRRAKYVIVIGSAVVAALIVAQQAGIRLNTTKSYPPGFYLLTDAPIEKGALVIFCPSDTPVFREARARGYIGPGFCPGGYGYMIKKIVASARDHVTMSTDGVSVNDTPVPNSRPMAMDKEGRPLSLQPLSNMELNNRMVLLMSDYSPKSFDGRYFGLVERSSIISTVRPLLTW
jgi:conjugative transfer signal peptidase TraF